MITAEVCEAAWAAYREQGLRQAYEPDSTATFTVKGSEYTVKQVGLVAAFAPACRDGQFFCQTQVGGVGGGLLGDQVGLALSGGSVLSPGAWVFMFSVFIGGYSIAFLIRKVWN